MRKISIFADSIIDRNENFFLDNEIMPIEHGLVVDGEEIFDGFCKVLTEEKIYSMLRDGKEISTVQGNIGQMYDGFEKALEQGNDVLYICFSSALSGTYNTAVMVSKEVMEKFPEGKIIVVDTKCAAAGHGILVQKAVEMKNSGRNIDEIAGEITIMRDYIHHIGFIDDLEFLKRGGRISKTTALVGGVIGIKPILGVTETGKIEPFSKARGTANAFKFLLEKITSNIDENEDVYISHCDNLAYAEQFKALVLEKTNIKNVHINYLGNTIGCHLGPDSMVVFFKGNKRF